VVEGFVSGMHRSLFHGFGTEFVQYRNYTKGDDLKYIDWKVYARHNRFQVKMYQEETNTNCYIVLDCSASMGYTGQRSPVSKLHYAKMIAASLAYLVGRQGDNVGLYAYNDKVVEAIRPGHRSEQIHRILVSLERLQAGGACDHHAVLSYLGETFNRRGLVVMITDCMDADEAMFKALRLFRVAHHDTVLFHLLDRDEVDFDFTGTVRFIDSEDGEEIVTSPARVRARYIEGLQAFLQAVTGFAARNDVDYHRLISDEPLAGALAAYLHRRESLGR
jgi:uncharacterized protein (DUF58 family)